MPTGPGDEILDAIEAGTADNDIIAKYKINNDQIKAFKTLYYGLVNKEVGYDEIGDYFPDINSYFTSIPPKRLLTMAREKVLLNKDIAAAGEPGTLIDKEKMVHDIDKEFQAQGYDPKDVTAALGDLPDLKEFDEVGAMQMRKDNPLQFDRYKSAIKSQYGLLKAVEQKEGTKAANEYLNNYIGQQKANDYQTQREATKQAVGGIYKYIDSNDEQRKVLGDLVKDKSFGYGIGLPGQDEAIANDPRSKNMNPYQVTAMQFLEDTDPATAQSFDRLLNFSPEEVEKLQSNSSFARGYENKGRELENIGMNLQKRAIEEKMTQMLPNKNKWTDQDKQAFAGLYERYNTLSADMENQPKRYPTAAAMDADRLMQDAMGKSKQGVVSKTLLGIGENADDALNWVGDLIQSPFQNNKESALDDLQKLGDKKLSQLSQYETEGQELFNRNYKTTFDPELKSQIDKIKNDGTLTEAEKQDQVREVILNNNFKGVSFVPNDKGGKMNFTAQTVLNSISNTVSEIVPQIALAYMTGGGANASKLKEYTSLFGSTFATAYNDYYTQALEENKPHPSQYALVNTAIEASTELINNNVEMAKKMFGGSKIGKIIEDVSQESANTLMKTGRFAALKSALQNTAKSSLKDAASEAMEEIVGQLGSNAANKALFHEDVDLTDDVLQSGVSAFVGMLPLGGLGLSAKYKEVSTMQKYALYQAAMNPSKFLSQIDEDLKAGRITQSDADNRKETITKASSILQGISAIRSDGTLMNDNQKTKYLFNQFVKETIKEKKKNLPDGAKEQFNQVEATIDNSINNLLKPRKNDSEAETKAETQSEAESQANGVKQPGTEPAQETSQPEAENNIGVGETAPVADMHYTNPEGTRYVLRGEDLYHVSKNGKETKFLEKAMQTKATQELVAKIKEANQKPSIRNQLEKLKPEQWQELRGNLPGNKNINTTTEMAKAYDAGDSEVVDAVNKYIQPQTEQNAIQKQGPEGVHVPPSSSDSAQVGEGNESQGAVNEEPTGKEEIKINTEDDVEREINKIYQNKAPRMDKGVDEMAPKEINNKVSENTFQDYHKKAQAVLQNLLPGLKIKAYDNSDEYYKQEGRPKGSLGSYDPTTHSIAFNMPLIEQHGKQSNVFHEILHPIVNKVIGENQEHLDSLFGELEGLKDIPELADIWKHHDLYYNRGAKIQKVEAITQFLTYVADGRIDTSKMEEKAITKIIDVINKILAALGIDKQISTASDLKRLSDSIKQAFQEQNTTALESTLGDRINNFKGADKVDELTGSDQENALREIIKKTPASITNEKLKEIIVRASGLSEQDAQDLIDEVRTPKIPPQPVKPTHALTNEERQASINKINNALNQPKPKEQSWLSKQWEGFKNASAWLDNPYRFITKIVEDINKHYGLTNKEAIPLGRQFEKTAAGRAALKIDSFINDIIRGNIDGEKLGKLTGEKYKDFQRYLFAKRVLDRLNKQEEKAHAGEDVNRQTGNVTYQDAEVMLQHLKNKYGDLDDFVKRGDAFQKHMDTMLQTLVASGILSKETYDQIKADNDFYAPFSVVQAKLLAGQDKQPVGISGVVKRIKGIDYNLIKSGKVSLSMINALGDALNEKIISPEEYFNTALQVLNELKDEGKISEAEYEKHIATLENPGFAINDILDAAANMIYKAEGMALKNTMLQRLYAYKASDKDGLFIQDVDGFKATTMPDGSTRMVPKPLDQIKVEPGMAPIKLRIDGKDKIVAVNKQAAEKLTQMSNFETSTFFKIANVFNKLFRAAVITLSPGFQAVNFMIDFVRTSMLSRYGPLAGKGLTQPIVNAALFMPQYIEALMHSAMGNLGYKTDTYKQWMNSDSFSKGMFDNLFDNEKRIKEVSASLAKRILSNFFKLHWIEVPGSILEQTHKIATHQRGMSVEGFKPEMVTAMLGSIVNRNINPNMTAQELKDGMDRLNYEVQNFAGSPNFPQTHKYMKLASMFLQFFSARVKGEMTDYRRVANLFSTITPGIKSGKGEGVKFSKQEALQMTGQFLGAAGMIAAYAIRNNMGDDDEKEFDGIPPYHQANYLNIPLGYFNYTDEDGTTTALRDYAKIPLRGLTATMNVMANSFVKFYKRQNPAEFKTMAEAFIGNASPINLQGKDERELGESMASNLTPVFKYFIEYSFNRDTHNHRNIVPDGFGKGMLSKYRSGDLDPWEVATSKTPQWAKDFSKFLFDNLGIRISAIELDHMEDTMGNPTELYQKAVKKRLLRSESKYPLYTPREEDKNTSEGTVTPIKQ